MSRSLVLSGGAVLGAYQVGALKYLINDLGIQYDSICGVSVGALNTSFLSMFPKGKDKEGLKNLENIWNSLDNSKIYKRWFPLGVVHGLWLDSIYDSQPLIDLVHSTLDLDVIRKNGRDVAVGAVSMDTGNYRAFTQNDDNFVDAVLASSSYPMALKPIIINNEKFTDGGVQHITPIKEAIDFGATDIDIIICSPVKTTVLFNDVDAITFGLRCFDFMTDQMNQSDLKLAELYNRLVDAGLEPNKRHLNMKIIRPTKDLGVNPLSFNSSSIKNMIDQGYLDAKQQYNI